MIAAAIAIVVLVACTVMSFQRHALFANAINLYEATLAGNPNSWLAANNRGALYDRAGNFEKSAALYEQAIRAQPDYGPAYFNYGVVLSAPRPDCTRAIDLFREALRRKPELSGGNEQPGHCIV